MKVVDFEDQIKRLSCSARCEIRVKLSVKDFLNLRILVHDFVTPSPFLAVDIRFVNELILVVDTSAYCCVLVAGGVAEFPKNIVVQLVVIPKLGIFLIIRVRNLVGMTLNILQIKIINTVSAVCKDCQEINRNHDQETLEFQRQVHSTNSCEL